MNEAKLAAARQRLAELQPRQPVALSAASVPETGSDARPPLQDTAQSSASASSDMWPTSLEAVAQGPDTDVQMVQEGAQESAETYLATCLSAPAPAPPVTAEVAVPTSSLPRDSNAWNGGEGGNLWPGREGEDPSCLRSGYTNTVNIAAAEAKAKPPAEMPQQPPGLLPSLPATSWIAGITAIADAAIA